MFKKWIWWLYLLFNPRVLVQILSQKSYMFACNKYMTFHFTDPAYFQHSVKHSSDWTVQGEVYINIDGPKKVKPDT